MWPIKFRAWDTSRRALSYEPWTYVSDTSSLNDAIDNYSEDVLMLYIGREDKTGAMIYKGDILKNDQYDKNRVWVVEYRTDSEYVGFVKVCKSDYAAGLASTFMSWEGCEVIGNIYENPELLDKVV